MENKADNFRGRTDKKRFSDMSMRSLLIGIVVLLVFCASVVRFEGYISQRRTDVLPAEAVVSVNGENGEAGENTKIVPEKDGIININSADAEELQTLSGIGPVKAQAIIDHRDSYGNFVTKKQIMDVSGIGEATYEKLEAYICVE